jgi:hypothetical protein
VAEHLVALSRALKPLGIRWYVFGAAEIDVNVVHRRLRELGLLVDDSTLTTLFEEQCREVADLAPKRLTRQKS